MLTKAGKWLVHLLMAIRNAESTILLKNKLTIKFIPQLLKPLKKINVGLKKYIDDTLKTQIGENMAKLIGLDKMASKI
jgi:hypothetical protein